MSPGLEDGVRGERGSWGEMGRGNWEEGKVREGRVVEHSVCGLRACRRNRWRECWREKVED